MIVSGNAINLQSVTWSINEYYQLYINNFKRLKVGSCCTSFQLKTNHSITVPSSYESAVRVFNILFKKPKLELQTSCFCLSFNFLSDSNEEVMKK